MASNCWQTSHFQRAASIIFACSYFLSTSFHYDVPLTNALAYANIIVMKSDISISLQDIQKLSQNNTAPQYFRFYWHRKMFCVWRRIEQWSKYTRNTLALFVQPNLIGGMRDPVWTVVGLYVASTLAPWSGHIAQFYNRIASIAQANISTKQSQLPANKQRCCISYKYHSYFRA